MNRHLARLADEPFDTLVIGGGIYGLSAAHALIQRGLSVALLERRDFGGATSFNSLKTVHGGIRSLQHGSVPDAREFVRERRAIALMAPHLVRVLPFVVPTALHPVRNRAAMRLFLLAYDAVARDRNDRLDPAVHLPRSFTVGKREALELNPLVDARSATGAAVWHDYQLHSPERFAITLARTVEESGGAVANHVEVTRLLRDGSRVTGAAAVDTLTGERFDIRAKLVVNAAGPWAWPLLAESGVHPNRPVGFSLALNLVLNRPPLPRAVGGIAAGRFLFLVPWRDRSILGTSHEGFHQGPQARPTVVDVERLLRDGNTAFPNAGLLARDITLVHRGLLPAHARGAAHAALLKQSVVHDHRADGISGLLTVLGVRYTTARASAQAAARLAEEILTGKPSVTPLRPLSGTSFNGLDAYLRQHKGRERLIRRYGTHHVELPSEALQPIAPATDVTRAEILHAVRNEMALTLGDVVLRRTDLATGGNPGPAAIAAAATLVAGELGWDASRTDREISAVRSQLAI